MLLNNPPGGLRRAVVDIGSNSVRLVIYSGEHRVPRPIINEKVAAKLGRTLQDDGRLPEKAMRLALQGLARFSAILRVLKISDPIVVATAAVRDAENGPQFLRQVRALGLDPRLLSGAEEAAASANGVRCAFPQAEGLVADLGGGSLEVVRLDRDDGITLPLGTLRVQRMREKGQRRVAQMVAKQVPKDLARGKPLYIVGGSWRALAQFSMFETGSPLTAPHGHVMAPAMVSHLVSVLSHIPMKSLQQVPGISPARLPSLVDAAIVLAALVRRVKPSCVIASSFGLREGLVFQLLPDLIRSRDPLIADLEQQLAGAAKGTIYGPPVVEWAETLFPNTTPDMKRLMLAAGWLALPLSLVDRPQRQARALELALHEPLVGIEEAERAQLAAALLGFVGAREIPSALSLLAPASALTDAQKWGAAMRFAAKFSAGEAALLSQGMLRIEGPKLVFASSDHGALFSESVEQHHRTLAERLDLEPSSTP